MLYVWVSGAYLDELAEEEELSQDVEDETKLIERGADQRLDERGRASPGPRRQQSRQQLVVPDVQVRSDHSETDDVRTQQSVVVDRGGLGKERLLLEDQLAKQVSSADDEAWVKPVYPSRCTE